MDTGMITTMAVTDPSTGVVLARISRGTGPAEFAHNWTLELLPDHADNLPRSLIQRGGRWMTKAETAEQAQRILTRAADAMSRYLNETERLNRSLLEQIDKATTALGATQPTLDES